MTDQNFPPVKNVIKKRTKSGQRYLMHGHDLTGKDVYLTIPISPSDDTKEYFRKIEETKIKLNEKILGSSFRHLVQEYIDYKQYSYNSSAHLGYLLAGFCNFDRKNKELVENIINSTTLKPSTKKRYLNSIKNFFRWLSEKKGLNLKNPANDYVIKSTISRRTRIITDEELERLLYICERQRNAEDNLFIRLAVFTGARISSIYALTPESLVDGKLYFQNVKCKKKYDYLIHLTDEKTANLFCTLAKRGYLWSSTFTQMSARCYKFLKKNFGRDQKGETLSMHSLRHSFASRAIQRGVKPEIIAKLLDHSSITTTLTYYAKHSQQQIDDAMDTIFKK